MRRGVQFASKRIEMEWPNAYAPMRDRLLLLADMLNREWEKSLVITCLTRTKEENDAIYISRGLEPKADSLHVVSPPRAVDIRSTTWINGNRRPLFTIEQTLAILTFWREGGKGFGGQDEPKNWHLHLQVRK